MSKIIMENVANITGALGIVVTLIYSVYTDPNALSYLLA